MNTVRLSIAALALAASLPAMAGKPVSPGKPNAGAPVAPAVVCSDSVATIGNAGYITCQGPIDGNIAPGQVNTATFAGYGTFDLVGATNDPNAGPFTLNPGTVGSGTLTFDSAQKGFFVLGIKGGPNFSLYLFDGGAAGITSLAFDTLGITTGAGAAGPGLSHATLFTQPFTQPVPEPESYAMMVAGLVALGAFARRRKAR